MDWSKAKTILIVGFLVTNVILFTVLLSNERQMEPTIKQEFVEEVIKLLKNKDISIDTEISREVPSLKTLIVEYDMVDISKVNKDFFLDKGFIEYGEKGSIEILNDDELVSIKNNKILKYENKGKNRKYNNLTEEKAKDISLKFLESKKYHIEDIKLSYIRENNGKYHLRFSKTHRGRYLETAYINVVVDSRGVRELERMWLNVEEEGENLIYINTAPKAVLDLLSMDNVYGKTIIDISLCYYFDPNQHEYIKRPEEARKGKTIPAWRVLFHDGSMAIIDNY